jgi:hypothetical protein
MAKAPLTILTAKRGDTFVSETGMLMKKVQSPFDPKGLANLITPVGVAAPKSSPGGESGSPLATHPGTGKVAAAPQQGAPSGSADPATVEQTAAAPDVPIDVQQAPAPAEVPQAQDVPDVNLEDAHLNDLRERQAEADANNQKLADAHAEMDRPPPTPPPQPVPTVAQQPQPIQAGMVPDSVATDVLKGATETPSAAMSGVKTAVRNMLSYSDHLMDLVEEHVAPGTMYWGPDGATMDTAANFAKHGVEDGRPLAQFDRAFPDNPGDHPKSVTGQLVKSISQFTTGFAAGGAALRGWKVAAGAGQLVKSFAQGALSDFGAFDAHQARLSDILKEHAPDAIKPVFEYLSSDPRDGESEGRLKNALEGLGLGGIAHGVIASARFLRAARIARRAAGVAGKAEGLQGAIDAPHAAVVAQAEKFRKEMAAEVGDARSKSFTTKRKFPLTPGEVSATAKAGEMGPNTIGLNYAKIASTDDLQAAAVQFYDAFHSEITHAKRGVQTLDMQIKDAFGVDVSRMLSNWKPGTAALAHELTAMRFTQAAVLRDFVDIAHVIAAEGSTLAHQAAFMLKGNILEALTSMVEGAKAEAARTLRSAREQVPAVLGDINDPATALEFFRKVDAMIASGGGEDAVRHVAKGALTVAKLNAYGMSDFTRFFQHVGHFNDRLKDLTRVFVTNGLLIPASVVKIAGANANALVWEPMLRTLAPQFARVTGAPSAIADREGLMMITGAISAFTDVFRLSDHIKAGWDIGEQGRTLAKNFAETKANTKGYIGAQRPEIVASQGQPDRFGMTGIEAGPNTDTALGRVASFVYASTVGSPAAKGAMGALKMIGRSHGVLDNFSQVISARAELAAQAWRKASQEADVGLIPRDQIADRMAHHIGNPDTAMLTRVMDAAQETSWTRKAEPGGATAGISKIRTWLDNLPIPLPLGTMVMPYVNTPANVFSYGMRNSMMAPLSSRWREAAMSGDEATKQLALTRFAVGSMFSMWMMNQVATGVCTGSGPRDPAQKQALMRSDPETHASLFRPYSCVIDGKWHSFESNEPMAAPAKMAADLSEAWMGNDWSDGRIENATEAFSAASMAIGNTFLEQATMQGASQFFDSIAGYRNGDPTAPKNFIEKRAVSLVPGSGVLRTIRKAVDPYQREVTDINDAFKDTAPGLSSTLPPSLDLWGRKRTYESGMGMVYDSIIPGRTTPVGGEPIDAEMLRLGYPKKMEPKSLQIPGGLTANLRNYPSIYNEIHARGGPPALAELNDLVTGASPQSDQYESLKDGADPHTPGSKASFLAARLRYHFGQAKASVQRDFREELAQIANEQAARKADARTGP